MTVRPVVFCLAIGLGAQLACTRGGSGSPGSPIQPSTVGRLEIGDITTSASAPGSDGMLRSGQAPPPAGGPVATATGNQRVVNGGTQTVTLASDTSFDRVFVRVGGRSVALLGESHGGVQGYYEIRLPGAQTSVSILLTFLQEIIGY